MTDKKKNIILVVGIIAFGLLLAGGTYAYMTFSATITNGSYSANTTCFDINYTAGSAITGTMFQSSTPKGGLDGSVTIGIDSSCSVDGIGEIALNVSSADDLLLTTVDEHCEDSTTLKTLPDYTTSDACTAVTGAVWVTSGTALKYAVYEDVSADPVSVGYVNGIKDIRVYNNFDVTSSESSYYIYVWLDGELADNSYVNLPFSGYIHAEVEQVE